MNCANEFCIYQKDNLCILDEISLNIAGVCENCIVVNFEQDYLDKKKKELLDKLY